MFCVTNFYFSQSKVLHNRRIAMLNRFIEKFLLSAALSIAIISCLCWGKIITQTYEQNTVASSDNLETQTIRQIRSNVTMFSGAIVVLARVVSIAANDEE